MTGLTRIMIAHPNSVGETYLEHMRFALRFAALLTAAGVCALLHAFLPFCFEKTASNIVRRLYKRVNNRGGQDA